MLITNVEHQIAIVLSVEGVLFGYLAISSTIGAVFALIMSEKDSDRMCSHNAFHAITVAFGVAGLLLSMFVGHELYEHAGTVGDWFFLICSTLFSVAAIFFSETWY